MQVSGPGCCGFQVSGTEHHCFILPHPCLVPCTPLACPACRTHAHQPAHQLPGRGCRGCSVGRLQFPAGAWPGWRRRPGVSAGRQARCSRVNLPMVGCPCFGYSSQVAGTQHRRFTLPHAGLLLGAWVGCAAVPAGGAAAAAEGAALRPLGLGLPGSGGGVRARPGLGAAVLDSSALWGAWCSGRACQYLWHPGLSVRPAAASPGPSRTPATPPAC